MKWMEEPTFSMDPPAELASILYGIEADFAIFVSIAVAVCFFPLVCLHIKVFGDNASWFCNLGSLFGGMFILFYHARVVMGPITRRTYSSGGMD
jgi:RsiW-degrading membrane proteinase PrsW (M82 family)